MLFLEHLSGHRGLTSLWGHEVRNDAVVHEVVFTVVIAVNLLEEHPKSLCQSGYLHARAPKAST